MTIKFEDMEFEAMAENYMRLKICERERNQRAYIKLQDNKTKYYDRLNENLLYQINRQDAIRNNPEKLAEWK